MKGGILMINYDLNIFSNNISTLHDTSKDDSNTPIMFLTDSMKPCYNFDKIKESFAKSQGISDVPRSADALYVKKDNEYTAFIEFKNGNINQKIIYEIHEKMYCCCAILSMILEEPMNYIRDHIDFYIVYNGEKNSNKLSQSKSRESIAKSVSNLSNEPLVEFNVKKFENFLYRKVYTYTEKEFENQFVQKYC